MLYDTDDSRYQTQDDDTVTMPARSTSAKRDDERSSEQTRQYVAIDLEMLKFHVIETMLRYFNAHVAEPDRPWQKISGLEDRFALGRELKAIWGVPETQRLDTVAQIFFGITGDSMTATELRVSLNEHITAVEAFLSH